MRRRPARPGHGVARCAFATAASASLVGFENPTREDRTVDEEPLASDGKAQIVESAERGQSGTESHSDETTGTILDGRSQTSHPDTHSQACRGLPDGERENFHLVETSTLYLATDAPTDSPQKAPTPSSGMSRIGCQSRLIIMGPMVRPTTVQRVALVSALLFVFLACESHESTTPSDAGGEVASTAKKGWNNIEPRRVDFAFSGALNHAAEEMDSPLQARTVLLNFWASWCVPCRDEMPALQQLSQAGETVVVGVSRDPRDEIARQLLAELDVSYPNWLDSHGEMALEVNDLIPFQAIPTSLLLVDGEIVATHIGPFREGRSILDGLDPTLLESTR